MYAESLRLNHGEDPQREDSIHNAEDPSTNGEEPDLPLTETTVMPSKVDGETPSWTIGSGKNIFLKFNCSALADPPAEPPAAVFHMAFRFVQADSRLVSILLKNHGFREVHQADQEFNLMWTGVHVKAHQLQTLQPHQRVNHFPRSYELTRKDRLYKNIEKVQRLKGPKHFNFIPQTFVLPGDYKELCLAHNRVRGPWIVKPIASSRGRGIYIVNSPEQIPYDETLVVAKYIDNPLLVDGYKCDLRLYVAVTCYDPLLIYLYEEGLLRLATVKYESSGQHLWNPCMHLCNYSINKYHEDYVKSEDPEAENVGHKWTLSALLRHLKKEGKDTSLMMQRIEDLIVKAILAAAPSIVAASRFVPNRNNCFELYGFDILIDSTLKPWLLEINLSPSLCCDSPLDMRIKSAVLADLLTLAGLPLVDPLVKHPKPENPHPSGRRTQSALTISEGNRKVSSCSGGLCPTNEELRIVRSIRAEYGRRGGFLRIFPSPDSWKRYASFLDPLTGLLNLGTQVTQKAAAPHNLNLLVHQQLYPELEMSPVDRLPKYERALSRGLKTFLTETRSVHNPVNFAVNINNNNNNNQSDRFVNNNNRKSEKEVTADRRLRELKMEIRRMLENGSQLSTNQARRVFAQYLQQVLARMGPGSMEGPLSSSELCLKFLQKASANLRSPFMVKIPSQKLTGKDRVALIAKQLSEYLHMYTRETELFYTEVRTPMQLSNSVFQPFMQIATESDLEEILTHHLNLYKCAHVFLGRCSTPPTNLKPQDLLQVLPQMCSFSSAKVSSPYLKRKHKKSLSVVLISVI
ncbi:UNVERIFIED_CONTAM: hypothetical protein PYX00_007625 [Menopon gallinae]|uniref:Tubulin--tyrosine ligase-like protein 5 n=1 Tax=Menopon gallinae TaxID=328185 RepID=A0AAW2HL09_9NEOP